jgi:hypothetical protein
MSSSQALSTKRRAQKLKQDFHNAACQYTELSNTEEDRHTAWRAFKLLVPYKNDKKLWEHIKAKSFTALLAEALEDDALLGTEHVFHSPATSALVQQHCASARGRTLSMCLTNVGPAVCST